MKSLKTTGKIDDKGILHVDVKTDLPNGDINLTITIEDKTNNPEAKYDFSDLKGKLIWEGDVLETQKKIREEWD